MQKRSTDLEDYAEYAMQESTSVTAALVHRSLNQSICVVFFALSVGACLSSTHAADAVISQSRHPATESDLRSWLTNMVGYHRFTPEEVHVATGLTLPEIDAAVQRF